MEKAKKTESEKLITASARFLRISPRKIRLVTNAIKNMNVSDALVQLQHMNKKAAPMVSKLVRSAIANAKNNFNLDEANLFIKSITTDMGPVMKRYFPRARGSAFVIRRKMSHIKMELFSKIGKKAAKRKVNLFSASKSGDKVKNIDHENAVKEKEEKKHIHKHTVKTDEQRKMNTIQNKRRMFNRKAGE